MSHSNSVTSKDSGLASGVDTASSGASSSGSSGSADTGKGSSTSSLTHKLASLGLGGGGKEHKRTFSLPGRGQTNKEKLKEKQEKQASKDNTINNTESGRKQTLISRH